MTEIATINDRPTTIAEVAPAPVFSMIERIMTDPTVSIERVEQAFAFYQKVQADQARRSFYAAFAEMQPSMPLIEKKGKGHNGKYAKWEDIVDGIRSVISEHGFSLSFRVNDEERQVRVTCILSHRDGHSDETSYPFPYDTSGNKPPIQAVASAISYGKRYTASALLNIVGKDEDDDGQDASESTSVISDEQNEELRNLITDTKTDIGKLLQFARAESLSDVLAKDFPRLKEMLVKKSKEASK